MIYTNSLLIKKVLAQYIACLKYWTESNLSKWLPCVKWPSGSYRLESEMRLRCKSPKFSRAAKLLEEKSNYINSPLVWQSVQEVAFGLVWLCLYSLQICWVRFSKHFPPLSATIPSDVVKILTKTHIQDYSRKFLVCKVFVFVQHDGCLLLRDWFTLCYEKNVIISIT